MRHTHPTHVAGPAATKTVKPRAPTATSIPSLLSLFQNEWDAVVLETYSLKQQLEQVPRPAGMRAADADAGPSD